VIAFLARPSVRPSLRPARKPFAARLAVESLEDRVVLAASAVAAPIDAVAATISDIQVTSVDLTGDQPVAIATVTGTLLGREFTQEGVEIPLNLGVENGAEGECDVLTLTLGPVDLNVLGLNVSLDDCAGGPVVIEVNAIPTGEEGGGLLGDLLCGVSGLLSGGDTLGDILGGLEGADLDQATGALEEVLTSVLDGVFDGLLGGGTAAEEAAAQQAGNVTDLLHLEIDELNLNLLGLEVDTSAICLDVTAEQGSGNLLGNLLGSIAHLLDKDPGNAINAKLNKLDKVLARAADDLLG